MKLRPGLPAWSGHDGSAEDLPPTRASTWPPNYRKLDTAARTLIHLRRAKYQDVLVMPGRRPVQLGTALAASFSVADADALDALADRIRHHAPDILDGPTDTPWNAREVIVRDPDGNTFVFIARARNPASGSVEDVMRDARRDA